MPSLGYIAKQFRTNEQNDHAAYCESRMGRFHLGDPSAGPVKVMLTDNWKDPLVVADIGFAMTRFHQLTGSCVGAGGGNACLSLISTQRKLATGPTKAFIPFWPFDYGRCRYNEGDRGQGEGAMGSSFADTIVREGVISASEPGLPQFQNSDGLVLTSSLEMQWSNGGSSLVTGYLDKAKVHLVGTAAPMNTTADIKAAILNGYPCSFACDNYIGNASLRGSGANAAVCGRWNGRGGHQQSVHGYWDNPDLGPLFEVMNNWPGDTYPADPAGIPTCGCWVAEPDVAAAMRLDAEVYAFSHLNWFPAQPAVLDWSTW